MGGFSPWHWGLVLLAFVLLFGAKKLPDTARGIGRSLRIFKAEMHADDPAHPADHAQQAPPPAAPPALAAPPVVPPVATQPPMAAPPASTPQPPSATGR